MNGIDRKPEALQRIGSEHRSCLLLSEDYDCSGALAVNPNASFPYVHFDAAAVTENERCPGVWHNPKAAQKRGGGNGVRSAGVDERLQLLEALALGIADLDRVVKRAHVTSLVRRPIIAHQR